MIYGPVIMTDSISDRHCAQLSLLIAELSGHVISQFLVSEPASGCRSMEGEHVRFLFKPYTSPLKLNCLPVRQKSFAATRRTGRLNVVNFIQRSGITSTTESFAIA